MAFSPKHPNCLEENTNLKDVYLKIAEDKYNPIDDDRFAILEYCENKMSVKEKEIVNLVINTFGMYGAKTLEKITHEETPWKNAREGYGDNIYSSEIITHESIKSYFDSINQKYDISTEKGLNKYINDMIYRVSVV